MRLLDLFCGAGGASMGYHRAGFDVVGVDLEPQPRYPFEFHQADALTYPLGGFDVIHASPPCQKFTRARHQHPEKTYVDLLTPMRERLLANSMPWIIENVMDAPMGYYFILCGTMFGLRVYRHRQFESSHLLLAPRCHHPQALMPGYVSIFGERINGHFSGGWGGKGSRPTYPLEVGKAAMGIDWMNRTELCQSIPPAYTEWIGGQLLTVIRSQVA